MMEKLTYPALKALFKAHEEGLPRKPLTACIVFTEDSFDKPYPLEARTYEVTSDNKAFHPRMGGYSLYGASLDGSDVNVRPDYYMADEHGGRDGWRVDYCYLVKEADHE